MGRPLETIEAAPVSKERDLYSWALRQAELLRAGRLAEIDPIAIAEEIDDVGEEQYFKLESALRVLAQHVLKWDYQPERRSRSWTLTIREQRARIHRQLRRNPSLKSRRDEALRDAYEDARLAAARETKLPLRVVPEASPFTFDELMERPMTWPGDEV
jgi:hypothetical protein